MVMVTDQNYYMEPKLKEKLDMMVKRCTGKSKQDNLLIFDGDEGHGKTTLSIQVAYYVAEKAKRKFDVNNVFFDIEAMMKFAMETKDEVILWDEAALAGLSSEWQRKSQKQLIKLVMVARKRRHFWIFNIPKFFKLNEYLVYDRAIGLVHVYARNEVQLGRFVYFTKKNKAKLYEAWRKSRARAYSKTYSFRGSFSSRMEGLIDEEKYDEMKDKAIMSIGKDDNNFNQKDKKLHRLQYFIATCELLDRERIMKDLEISERTIQRWRKIPEEHRVI